MRRQGFWRFLVAGAITAVMGVGGVVTAAGSADAASPTVLSSCVAAVQGEAGQAVALDPASVTQPILDALAPLDPLNAIRPVFLDAWRKLPPIAIGSFPDPGSQALITGVVIANAVVGQLHGIPVLSPVLDVVVQRVWAVVSQACGVVVQGVAMVGTGLGTGQPPAPAPPGGPTTAPPVATSAPPAAGSSAAPSSPAAGSPSPSAAVGPANERTPWPGGPTIGGRQPGGAPQSGGIPPDHFSVSNGGPTAPFDLNDLQRQLAAEQTAGHAESLPDAHAAIGRGIILAALVLALVAAQLARRWALRTTPTPKGDPAA